MKNEKLNAPLPWIGGKRLLRSKIAQYIPEQDIPISKREIKNYVEVFGGMAWLMLFKNRWFECEIYNDLNDEVTTLFKVIKYHPDEFVRQFDLLPNSQHVFDYFLHNDVLTDIQKAVKTYYKYAYSFSANGEDFGLKNRSRDNALENIKKLYNRFKDISIINMSYDKIIGRFNKNNTFLYCDPPYWEKEYLYHVKFSKDDHLQLRDLLKSFKGNFILSYNNEKEIKLLYSGFNIVEIEAHYTAFNKGSNHKKAQELLIMNY